jgi:dihydrofolate reductase
MCLCIAKWGGDFGGGGGGHSDAGKPGCPSDGRHAAEAGCSAQYHLGTLSSPHRIRGRPIALTSGGTRMAKLIYAINTSLDGFIEDASGAFDWSMPDDEVHTFYNDMMRGVGTQLLGRRMYETMAVWETDSALAEESPILADFAAAWRDSDKDVYSTTLIDPITTRTRIVREFDAGDVRALKEASSGDILVGGATLAAHLLRAGLVDELLLTLFPVAVGGGKPALPNDLRLNLQLIEERRLGKEAVHVAYRVRQ